MLQTSTLLKTSSLWTFVIDLNVSSYSSWTFFKESSICTIWQSLQNISIITIIFIVLRPRPALLILSSFAKKERHPHWMPCNFPSLSNNFLKKVLFIGDNWNNRPISYCSEDSHACNARICWYRLFIALLRRTWHFSSTLCAPTKKKKEIALYSSKELSFQRVKPLAWKKKRKLLGTPMHASSPCKQRKNTSKHAQIVWSFNFCATSGTRIDSWFCLFYCNFSQKQVQTFAAACRACQFKFRSFNVLGGWTCFFFHFKIRG